MKKLAAGVVTSSVLLGGPTAEAAPPAPPPQYLGCSSEQQEQIVTAAEAADALVAGAHSHLATRVGATRRYTTWFGTFGPARKSTVQSHFQQMGQVPFANHAYDCATCSQAGIGSAEFGKGGSRLLLCRDFWAADATGRDSRAGALVNLVSRFPRNGGAADGTQGHQECKALAAKDPAAAVQNAASHQYFAENTPTRD